MSMIDRSGAEVLIPEERSREILQNVPEQSVCMRMMRRLPDMSSKTRSLPVLSSLPVAYFVEGDTGFKKTTNMAWDKKRITAEEIACIVPIPQSVLDDSDYDIWGNVRPRIEEAIGAAFDGAALFEVNKPASFPDGIVSAAIAAGNHVTLDPTDSLYQQLLGEGGLISMVEEDGYVPDGYIGAIKFRSKMRGCVDNNGLPIFGRAPYQNGVKGRSTYELDGTDIFFPRSDVMDDSQALLIGGDWTQAVWAIRTDINIKLLTEATIQNPADGSIVYNLAQQDMVALRVFFRAGWQIANPVNRVNADNTTRYPFAVLRPAAAASQGGTSGSEQGGTEGGGQGG